MPSTMTPDQWQRVTEILEAALDRDAIERAAFLDRACGNDVELRQRLDALLASDQSMGDFLAAPIVHLEAVTELAAKSELPAEGRLIGPYQILREIGHGG